MKDFAVYETREIADDIGGFLKRRGAGDYNLIVMTDGWRVVKAPKKVVKRKPKKPAYVITLRKKKAVR